MLLKLSAESIALPGQRLRLVESGPGLLQAGDRVHDGRMQADPIAVQPQPRQRLVELRRCTPRSSASARWVWSTDAATLHLDLFDAGHGGSLTRDEPEHAGR